MKSKFTNLLIGLITTVIGVVLGWYLSDVYKQPKILWYSRPYYKIADAAIGNIYLWNDGREPDRNVTITLDGDIKESNIKIVDLVSPYSVKHNDNKTIIQIEELKPMEAADVTFKDDPSKDDILFELISEHSNVKEVSLMRESEWWRLPLEIVIAVTTLFIGLFLGYLFSKKTITKSLT